MGYETALSKAWQEFLKVKNGTDHSVRFLSDNYNIDPYSGKIISESCNIPAKDYISILILHYLARKAKGLPPVKEEWISFKELAGGQGYFPAFKKRVIGPVLRKYSAAPEKLYDLAKRFQAKKAQVADAGVVVETFEGVPVLIALWRGDEEFGPEANVSFDKSIQDIFCTEDIVVLSEIVAHSV